MANYTYYCEVKQRVPEYPQGVYRVITDSWNGAWYSTLNHLMTVSERVWRQGPRGGVKLVKSPWYQLWPTNYITNNEKYMQEFSWIKLQAKELA